MVTSTTFDELNVTQALSDNGAVILSVQGPLNGVTFERLEESIQRVFDQGKHRLILDLAKVPSVSSSGAGVLMSALAQAQENNGNIVLVHVGSAVRDILELLNLDEILPIAEDMPSALAFV